MAAKPDVVGLGRACVVVGIAAAATVVVPFSPSAPRLVAAAMALTALTVGWGLLHWAARVPTPVLHGVLGLAVALVTLCVALSTTPVGAAVTASGFIWIAVYSAAFHHPSVLRWYVLAIACGLAVGLWAAGAAVPVQTWLYLMATVGGVAWVLNARFTHLASDAMRDALTGLVSRRELLRLAGREVGRAARTRRSLTLVVLDLDGFKRVNDEQGHAAGDAVLVGLARSWLTVMRPGDVLGRLGGDEFALVLPATDEVGARAVLDRLSAADGRCSWSFGIAGWQGESVDEWFERADRDLYRAKAVSGQGSSRVP